MKGVPFARAPATARSIAGRTSASASSIGSMNDMASVDPGASAATWRRVAAIASWVRYMLTPVDATTAGRQQTGGKLRPTLGEGVQPRSEDDVLPDATGSLFRDEIFDEAGAGHDRGAEGPRERAHVRTTAPSVVWSRQLQADFVFEHVQRRIDFYVQRPHQGDPHRRVVWRQIGRA